MTTQEMEARIKELEGKLAKKSTISFKVSDKGAVSVYGLGRFPVTLYGAQWDNLLAQVDTLKAFLKDHAKELATK